MNIQPTTPVNFGIYQTTKFTRYGKINKGIINGKKLDIYTAYENFDDKGELKTIRSTNYDKNI